jgi:hypothetical protein
MYPLLVPSVNDRNDNKVFPEQQRYVIYYSSRLAAQRACNETNVIEGVKVLCVMEEKPRFDSKKDFTGENEEFT